MRFTTKIEIGACPGCGRKEVKHHAKGLCNACYHRMLRGDKSQETAEKATK